MRKNINWDERIQSNKMLVWLDNLIEIKNFDIPRCIDFIKGEDQTHYIFKCIKTSVRCCSLRKVEQ